MVEKIVSPKLIDCKSLVSNFEVSNFERDHVSSNSIDCKCFFQFYPVVKINGDVPLNIEVKNRIWLADSACTPCCELDSVSNLKFEKLRVGF